MLFSAGGEEFRLRFEMCVNLTGSPKSSIFFCWAHFSTQSFQAWRHLWPHWLFCGRSEGWEHTPVNSVLNPRKRTFNSPHRMTEWWPGSMVMCARASSPLWVAFLSDSLSIPAPALTSSKTTSWRGGRERPAGNLRMQLRGRAAMPLQNNIFHVFDYHFYSSFWPKKGLIPGAVVSGTVGSGMGISAVVVSSVVVSSCWLVVWMPGGNAVVSAKWNIR